MTELDYAWAAGFLDGDGSFSLRVYKRKGRYMVQPVVQASQQCPEPLERLYKIADGGSIYDKERSSVGRQMWKIQIVGIHRLTTFLEGIVPYLIVKQRQCDLLLQALHKQKNKGECGIGCSYTKDEWTWFFECKKQIEALNVIT